MRVAITGDRYWDDEHALMAALSTLDPETDFVILGDARGADYIAWQVCKDLGLPYRRHFANWARYKGSAGPKRNTAMLDDGAEEVWYFHLNLNASRGTKNCVEQARDRGIPVRDGLTV